MNVQLLLTHFTLAIIQKKIQDVQVFSYSFAKTADCCSSFEIIFLQYGLSNGHISSV